MRFNCRNQEDEWEGSISSLITHKSSYEFWVKSRSSIMVVCGSTSRGGFVCLPDFKVGCHLTDLRNKFWNNEQLVEILGKVDGITVSTALFQLANVIKV